MIPWRRLGKLDERFRPLQLLGEGRTWLGQVDGSVVAENARSCLGSLGHWLQSLKRGEKAAGTERGESSIFLSWWIDEVQSHVFGSEIVARYADVEDLDPIRERLHENALLLDRLEEDWVGHWARA